MELVQLETEVMRGEIYVACIVFLLLHCFLASFFTIQFGLVQVKWRTKSSNTSALNLKGVQSPLSREKVGLNNTQAIK